MISDPFDVLGDKQQVGADRNAPRVLDHVGQRFAKQASVHVVERFVRFPDGDGLVDIAGDISIQHVVDHLLRHAAHARY